jgi:tRNA pseudouridine55 synthase
MATDSTPPTQSPKPDLHGFLLVDKPVGPTSMQAVARVRHRAGRVKTGHAGTLDPLATGMLVLGLGRATKHLQNAMATHKVYETCIDLAGTCTTLDAEVEATPVDVPNPPNITAVNEAIAQFHGDIMQAPPAFSAMKVNGQRAYALARKGVMPDLPPRPVVVHALEVLAYEWPRVTLRVHCGKGFYVRSLARDLGEALGTGGWCVSIRRTAVGPFTIDAATPLDDVPDVVQQSDLLSLETVQAMLADSP